MRTEEHRANVTLLTAHEQEFVSNPSTVPALLNSRVWAKSYTFIHIFFVLDFWAELQWAEQGCSSGYYPAKSSGTKQTGTAAANLSH